MTENTEFEIIVAKTAGFCFGVERVIDLAINEAAKSNQPVYSYGPLVHNPQAVKMLESHGIEVSKDITSLQSSTVIVRSHGLPPNQYKLLQESCAKLVDGTCPKVKLVHKLVEKANDAGDLVIIIGDADHAEVKGIMGFADNVRVIKSESEIANLPPANSVTVVAQTTQDVILYQKLTTLISQKYPKIAIKDTICNSTYARQNEVRDIASKVDYMIVVGGKNSANVTRLAEISRELNVETIHIETENELPQRLPNHVRKIGVTAGASTPLWQLERVVRKLKSLNEARSTSMLKKLVAAFAYSNLLLAASGGFLAYISTKLANISFSWSYSFLAGFFIWAIHTANQFLGGQVPYAEALKEHFYSKYKRLLITISITAGFASVVLGLSLGIMEFGLVLIALLGGAIYRLPIFSIISKYVKFKLADIPASRGIFLAFGWTLVACIIPIIHQVKHITPMIITTTMFVFFLSLIISLLRELRDVHEDMAVGKETMATLLGHHKTNAFLISLIMLQFILTAITVFLTHQFTLLFIVPLYILIFRYAIIMRANGVWFEIFLNLFFAFAAGAVYFGI